MRIPFPVVCIALCACNAIAGIREPKDFAGKWSAAGTETIAGCNNGNNVAGPTSYEFEFVRADNGLVAINRDFSSLDGSDVCKVRLAISGTKASLQGDAPAACAFRFENDIGRTTYTSIDFDLGDESGKGSLTIRGSLQFTPSGVTCTSYSGTFTMAQTAEAN